MQPTPKCQNRIETLNRFELLVQNIRKFNAFYAVKGKVFQDNFLLKYMVSDFPKRERARNER